MALTQDRVTPVRDAEMVPVLLAAATKVYQGGIAVVNAAGYGVPGSTSTTQTYIGRFEETVDNSGGSAGAKSAMVRRKKAFAWKNSSADPVTQAGLFKDCYIVDDETVAATNGTNTRSKAGKVIAIDSNGVWVE